MAGIDSVATAHARMMRDASLQFSLDAMPPPPKPPPWLVELVRWIGKMLIAGGPVLKWLFLIGLLAAIVALLAFVARELWINPRAAARGRALTLSQGPGEWRPDALRAKALLEDADRLAAEGRYQEAARVLLWRSIDDIEGRRPRLIAPSLTARDIAGLQQLPTIAREAFGLIASMVERAVFGGRLLDDEAWRACRDAYGRLAFGESWGSSS